MTRVVVLDQHVLVRDAWRRVLAAVGTELAVVADCDAAEDVVAVAHVAEARVVLVDLGVVDTGLGELCARLRGEVGCRVLAVDREPDDVRLVASVEAGADGYVSRLDDVGELVEAVLAVADGRAHIPSDMLGTLLRSLITRQREREEAVTKVASLSRREVEVLALLADGGATDAIAEELFISPATVRTHVQNVLRKLGVHSQVEATALVRRHDLLAADIVGSAS